MSALGEEVQVAQAELSKSFYAKEAEANAREWRKKALLVLINHFLQEAGLTESAALLQQEARSTIENFSACDNVDLETILTDYEIFYHHKFRKKVKLIRYIPENGVVATSGGNKVMNGMAKAARMRSRYLLQQPYLRRFVQDREAIVYPRRFPEVFVQGFEPWKGLLLHGPPGTGKTLLAKAVASESGLPFFNVTASTVISKWRGESEKAIKVLFDMARKKAPSIIFIDELDALGSRRTEHDHDASRRTKTELLVQLDGLTTHSNKSKYQNSTEFGNPFDTHIFVLAATNMAWDVDPALLRRLEKHVLIKLPNSEEREVLFRKFLSSGPSKQCPSKKDWRRVSQDFDFKSVAKATEGFTGSDIYSLCKEAVMASVRAAAASLPSQPRCENKLEQKLLPVTTSAIMTAIREMQAATSAMQKKKLGSGGRPKVNGLVCRINQQLGSDGSSSVDDDDDDDCQILK
ncbi:unnamed protein product [Notodromas monacha]|uniref:AAA+ ATPase domain-containing protein n=1 Tax=Notodromas monacha TaxID=399045 RepID=A0A7R9GEX1_9CRUS|nr:unnamed protein product [Notodromas monacha]CAG0920185.1 unnamed protein product [Notodromas monacha]